MRNDYTGYGILKDIEKYKIRILKVMLKSVTCAEKKTLIKIQVNGMNYKELVNKLKELGA
jgi:hypothetical protein